MCNLCQTFLYDFLLVSPHKDLPISKQIRIKSLRKILPEFVHWCQRMNARIQKDEFEKAIETASRIARRGRKLIDYEFLIHTATFNFLKFSLPWLTDEINYMKLLFIEAGVIVGKEYPKVLHHSQEYLSYLVPRTILVLRDLHEDHANPKGLYTDLNKLFISPQQEEKEIELLDDLYT